MKINNSGMVRRWAVLPAVTIALATTVLNMETATAIAQRNNSNNTNYSRMTLPSGTVIPVTLDNSLSSKDNQRGDKFTGTVKYGNDDSGLPEGTRIEGVVQEAIQSDRDQPGVLDVDIRRMIFPDGTSKAITASLYSLDGKATQRNDGRLTATSDKSKDRLKWVGIGSGGGLLVGALTKHNELFSTLLGAGAGYLFNEFGNKPKPGNVTLKQGTSFGVRLDKSVEVSSSQNSTKNGTYRNSSTANIDDQNYNRRQHMTQTDRTTYGQRTYLPDETNDITMRFNDREVQFSQTNAPYMRGEYVMVPLALIGRSADFDCRYVSNRKAIYARNDSVRLTLGSRKAVVDGEQRDIPVGAEMHNGSVYVPLEVVGWAADAHTKWDSTHRVITMNTDNK